MFWSLDAWVDVVVTEIPELIGADGITTARADQQLTALDTTCELPAQTMMAGAVELALALVAYQSLSSLLSALDLARCRSSAAVGGNHGLSRPIGEECKT